MPRIRGEIVIARPVDVVFDFVADEANEPRYNPQMLRVDPLADGPVGVGSRWAVLVRARRWPASMVVECTEYERPFALGTTTTMPNAEIRGRLTFEPIPEGTRMSWDWQVRPTGRLRLLSPLVGLVGARQERAIWTGLKTLLESEAGVRRPAAERAG